MSFDHDSGNQVVDKEMQTFLAIEQQKAQFQAQVHRLNEICWDKCIDKPSSKLDGRTETCLTNCVDRFIDTSLAITNRFAQLLQRSAEHT
ncbi:mitochondrial import inner membrane translocase subunit Tim8-like [Ornithodoros turicata]|uniref:Mitochondrial import inner membrane translocase subunit n=2 Tax=Ornithodoros TaxID=6937 RepID=A6NA11_ORNPR|nr:mitochondrial import inner membrane translocase subunit Tim8-like protein [Ornithodoros parkeri]